MLKKLTLTSVFALACNSVFAAPPPQSPTQTPLILLQDLDQVHIKWGSGAGTDKAVDFNNKDMLLVDIPVGGVYSFQLLREANSNYNASFKLYIDNQANPFLSTVVAGGWLFENITLTDDSHVFDLKITTSEQGAGNPRMSQLVAEEPDDPTAVVPEPASITMVGLGLLGLAAMRRRRK